MKVVHSVRFLSLVVLLISAVGASCARYVPVNQPSGSQLQFQLNRNDYTIMGFGHGEACEKRVLGLVWQSEYTYNAAIRRAILSQNGNHIIQTSSDIRSKGFFLWDTRCLRVSGIVVQIKNLPKFEKKIAKLEPQPEPIEIGVTHAELVDNYNSYLDEELTAEFVIVGLRRTPEAFSDYKNHVFIEAKRDSVHKYFFLVPKELLEQMQAARKKPNVTLSFLPISLYDQTNPIVELKAIDPSESETK